MAGVTAAFKTITPLEGILLVCSLVQAREKSSLDKWDVLSGITSFYLSSDYGRGERCATIFKRKKDDSRRTRFSPLLSTILRRRVRDRRERKKVKD